MKPLLKNNLTLFLKRFDNFKDAEFRSVELISPTNIKIVFAAQDSTREYNWITISFELSGVKDAKLIEENKIPYIDMSDGISIINIENEFAFAIGECYNISSIKNSICYVISSNLKYQEGTF
jgi:hypothetical protein